MSLKLSKPSFFLSHKKSPFTGGTVFPYRKKCIVANQDVVLKLSLIFMLFIESDSTLSFKIWAETSGSLEVKYSSQQVVII